MTKTELNKLMDEMIDGGDFIVLEYSATVMPRYFRLSMEFMLDNSEVFEDRFYYVQEFMDKETALGEMATSFDELKKGAYPNQYEVDNVGRNKLRIYAMFLVDAAWFEIPLKALTHVPFQGELILTPSFNGNSETASA